MGKIKFFAKNFTNLSLLIYIFQILLLIDSNFCGICKNVHDLSNKTCYNDVITFNHSQFLSGHACTNKQGNMIVEFSVDDGDLNLRLFYGLNKKGRYYFPGEPVYKEIRISNCVDCEVDDLRGRYEARNLLVHLKDDTNREKEYMFSMSSFYSVAELIDIDDRDNFNLFTWNMTKFIDISRPIFSYEYSLFEIGNTNKYIAAFIESAGFKEDPNDGNKLKEYSENITLKKFTFDNFNSENYRTILKSNTTKNTFDGRVVSAFRLDESNLIAVMIVFSDQKYRALFFDDDLVYKGECSIWDNVVNLWKVFFLKGFQSKVIMPL